MFHGQVSTEVNAFVLQAEAEMEVGGCFLASLATPCDCLYDGTKPHDERAAIAREVYTSAILSLIFEGAFELCHTSFSEKEMALGLATLLSQGKL